MRLSVRTDPRFPPWLRAGVRLQSTISERTVRIGTPRGTNRVGDLRAEDITRRLAMLRRFLTTKDVTKVCPRLKIGKNQTGIKVKDFRRGTCE